MASPDEGHEKREMYCPHCCETTEHEKKVGRGKTFWKCEECLSLH